MLSQRLTQIEDYIDTSSILTCRPDNRSNHRSQADKDSVESEQGNVGAPLSGSNTVTHHFGFESDLAASRPYLKAKRSSLDFSFRESVSFSHAWTILSDVSLADISNISCVALPVLRGDVLNLRHYDSEQDHSVSLSMNNLARIGPNTSNRIKGPFKIDEPARSKRTITVRHFLTRPGELAHNVQSSIPGLSLDDISPSRLRTLKLSVIGSRLADRSYTCTLVR